MNRFLLVIFLFLSSLSAQSQSLSKLEGDTIIWREGSRLEVSDFKAKPKGQSAGLTYCGIYLNTKEANGTLLYNVEAIFIKSKSFLKGESAYILNHEQIHFDMSELYARKLRQMIAQKDFTKVNNIQKEIQSMYNKTFNDFNKEQQKYDKETQHSMNAARQKIWDEDIAKRIAELNMYKETYVDITSK